MLITRIEDVPAETWATPGKKYQQRSKPISVHLGRDGKSTDLLKRHPFDLEHCTVPAHSSACPYHSHSAQWEMYVFLSGTGFVRAPDGRHAVGAGHVVLCPPGEAHEIINESGDDLVFFIIADNPFGESCYYPDSDKWAVRDGTTARGRIIKGVEVDYLHGEEPGTP